MRTALEMRTMAERYPSKGLISAIDSGKLPFHLIEESLLPGEDVLLAFGAYAGHIGNYSSEIRSALFDQIQGILEQYQGGGMPGAPVLPQSPAEEIRAYKALLDEGILTQAEFEAKKKQLLGL